MIPSAPFSQLVLFVCTPLLGWLLMQAVHEAGHVLAASLTGGEVRRVILHPLEISRTELGENPRPGLVAWAGPVLGVLVPLAGWGVFAALQLRATFLARFFAGFCLIANGAYIAGGSFAAEGDAREMLRAGSPAWTLWLFGAITVPLGLWLWHGQGEYFGLGKSPRAVSTALAYSTLALCLLVIVVELITSR